MKMRKEIYFGIGLIILSILSRFIPHPPNFTPVMAVALFSGAILKDKYLAIAIPVLVMFLTDLVLGLHESVLAVYACMGLFAIAGTYLKKDNYGKITIFSLLSSVIFFIVTNLSIWLFTDFYKNSIEGLITCYVMAIPFFGYNIVSTLLFSFVLFGSYNLFLTSDSELSEAN